MKRRGARAPLMTGIACMALGYLAPCWRRPPGSLWPRGPWWALATACHCSRHRPTPSRTAAWQTCLRASTRGRCAAAHSAPCWQNAWGTDRSFCFRPASWPACSSFHSGSCVATAPPMPHPKKAQSPPHGDLPRHPPPAGRPEIPVLHPAGAAALGAVAWAFSTIFCPCFSGGGRGPVQHRARLHAQLPDRHLQRPAVHRPGAEKHQPAGLLCVAGLLAALSAFSFTLLPPLPAAIAGSVLLGLATGLNIPHRANSCWIWTSPAPSASTRP